MSGTEEAAALAAAAFEAGLAARPPMEETEEEPAEAEVDKEVAASVDTSRSPLNLRNSALRSHLIAEAQAPVLERLHKLAALLAENRHCKPSVRTRNKELLWQDHQQLLLSHAAADQPMPTRLATMKVLACLADAEDNHESMWMECREILLAAAGAGEPESLRRPALWCVVHLSTSAEVRRELWQTHSTRGLLLRCLAAEQPEEVRMLAAWVLSNVASGDPQLIWGDDAASAAVLACAGDAALPEGLRLQSLRTLSSLAAAERAAEDSDAAEDAADADEEAPPPPTRGRSARGQSLLNVLLSSAVLEVGGAPIALRRQARQALTTFRGGDAAAANEEIRAYASKMAAEGKASDGPRSGGHRWQRARGLLAAAKAKRGGETERADSDDGGSGASDGSAGEEAPAVLKVRPPTPPRAELPRDSGASPDDLSLSAPRRRRRKTTRERAGRNVEWTRHTEWRIAPAPRIAWGEDGGDVPAAAAPPLGDPSPSALRRGRFAAPSSVAAAQPPVSRVAPRRPPPAASPSPATAKPTASRGLLQRLGRLYQPKKVAPVVFVNMAGVTVVPLGLVNSDDVRSIRASASHLTFPEPLGSPHSSALVSP